MDAFEDFRKLVFTVLMHYTISVIATISSSLNYFTLTNGLELELAQSMSIMINSINNSDFCVEFHNSLRIVNC